MHLLILTNEDRFQKEFRRGLSAEGYTSHIVSDLDDAIEEVASADYHAVVVDASRDPTDALVLCRALRRRGFDTPILVLTKSDDVMARVRSLDAGADDCLSKPFAFVELVARLRALIRRTSKSPGRDVMSAGELVLDVRARQATHQSVTVDLTAREFGTLEVLMRHPNQVITRAQLLAEAFGLDYMGASNVVDVYVRYLRTKLDLEPRAGSRSTHIETVRGVGYRLRVRHEALAASPARSA